MSVHAMAVTGVVDVFAMCVEGLAEQINTLLGIGIWIRHGLAEGDALVRHAATGLCAAHLEATGGYGFVDWAVLVIHLMVCKLNDHLHVGIWRALEFLDQTFAVSLICLDLELVRAKLALKVLPCGIEVKLDFLVHGESDRLRVGKVAPNVGPVEGNVVLGNEHTDSVIEPVGGSAIHHAVFTHEAGRAIVIDDELEWLVKPPVAAVAVPVLVCALFKRDWGGIVEADKKGSGLDGLERCQVSRRSGYETLAIL
jgi:hypothetical protein